MYETDQEQIEAIKSWWSQNGNWVIGAFIVFILAYVGYNWYQSNSEKHRFDASAIYDQLMVNITSNAPDAEMRQSLSTILKSEYSDLGYGALAALIEAKAAVDAGDLEKALVELDWALENGDASLQAVVLYRKAQVQYALNKLDAAITSLNAIQGDGHQALSFELKGDVLLEQGKRDEARSAYKAALDLSNEQTINNPFLKIKLDDLAVAE